MQHQPQHLQELNRILIPYVKYIQDIELSASELRQFFLAVQFCFNPQEFCQYYTQTPDQESISVLLALLILNILTVSTTINLWRGIILLECQEMLLLHHQVT